MATTFWIQRSAMALGIVLLALCTSLRAQGQISPGQQRALSTLNAIAMALPPESANTEIRWLTDSARNTRVATGIPSNVLDGLEANLAALKRSSDLPTPARRDVIAAVIEDLRLKAEYCRMNPDGMAAQVALTVRTWARGDSRSEASQWQVMYISAPLAGFPGRKGEPFPQFSSPTSHSLPPGAYVLWAQDPNRESRRGPEVTVRLGGAGGNAKLAADLLVAGGL